jgi:hypothetical protein
MKKASISILVFISIFSCKKETTFNSIQLEQEISGSSVQSRIPSIEKGLVAHFPFDGDFLDKSINANHGINFGTTAVKDRKGKARKAISFNGTANYISLGKPFFEGGLVSQLTYSVWFKIPSYPGTGNQYTISDKQGFWREVNLTVGTAGDMAFWWTFPNPQAYYGHYSNENIVPLNKWNHYVVTMNGQNMVAYLNGKVISARNLSTNGQLDFSYLQLGNSTNTNIIGATSTVSPGLLYFFRGELDDFRIYNRSLTAAEVSYLYAK